MSGELSEERKHYRTCSNSIVKWRRTGAWRTTRIAPRGSTRLGVSFRPPQLAPLGLELESTFVKLMAYPFQLIRLGASG